VEVSLIRNRLRQAIARARDRARDRRRQTDEAAQTYTAFLNDVATPVMRMVANVLKAEGYQFTVFTPGGGLRLADDRHRDDYIEFALDTAGDSPEVVGRIRQTRGSRILDEERPIKRGARIEMLTDEDVLAFLIDALAPWLER
jgi:hypothetical protein